MGYICSKKMVVAIETWIRFYNPDDLDDETRTELLSMSAATIDRYLCEYKKTLSRKKRTGTRPANRRIKALVPIKDFDFKADCPGHFEADTVAHCGDSLSGKHIWSLTITDVYSGWTENRAIFGKMGIDVLDAICNIEYKLPFKIKSFNTDNGTEFLNQSLIMHFGGGTLEERRKVAFTRSRAYKKNDNCHVEQKNFTHVRELFGYERFDKEELVFKMNEIYKLYHNVLQNFFIPQLKLVSKQRIGAKYKRQYEKPKTPYQRLLESPSLTMRQKADLKRIYRELDPFELKKQLSIKLREFFKYKKSLEVEFEDDRWVA
ncbi:MAG: transposase family protein [Oligoflexia bacterium]|nr:transposase family protein [Oligoflexia bacterium]